MSGTLSKRPEFMILIAVAVAAVLGIICTAASCSMIAGAAGNVADRIDAHSESGVDDLIDEYGDIHGYDDIEGIEGIDDLEDLIGGYNEEWGEQDVPAAMDIDVPELQDDLQAMINYDLSNGLHIENAEAKVTSLTKDEVATPYLHNGQVLSQVKGVATIENAGSTAEVGYTSYYYAEDPTAEKITWYIYGYDLDSYDLFPDGFQDVSGDTLGYRSFLLDEGDQGGSRSDIARDRGQDATSA